MAVGHVSTTSGTAGITAGTTATATVTASVGETLILVAGADNRSAADALPANAVTDAAGNTWSRLLTQQNTGTSSAHCAIAIYGCVVTSALTAQTVTLTAQVNVPIKDFTLYRFTGLSLTVRGLNSGQVTATTPAALATSAPLAGDLIIAATVLEGPTSDTWTADTDTTGGTWSASTSDGTTGGTATSQITIESQWKVCNASGTQTYNGSNSVSRDMCRGIIALAPTPPPAAAPLPPSYTPQYGVRFSTSTGRMTAAQIDSYAIGENFNPALPPVVWSTGVASDAGDLTGVFLPGLQPIFHAILDLGFAIVTPTTLFTFGNAAAMTGITDALTFARNTLGCSSGRAVLIGGSEGACDSLTYAYTNPTLVACVVGIIPLIDLAEMVEQNVLGLSSAVLSAWSVGALPLPAGADPNTAGHRTTLAQIPIQLWYSTDDEVSANITSFQGATGCDARAVGQLWHTNAAIAAAWPTEIARFIRTHVPVRFENRVF